MSEQGNDVSGEAVSLADQDRERRTTLRALKSWSNARVDGAIPGLADLTGNSKMMEGREIFTENQFLIMFEAYSTNLVVIFYGSELPDMLVGQTIGHNLKQSLPMALKDVFLEACMEAVDGGDVVYRHGMISVPSGAGVLYRSIFMPLRSGSDPDRIYIFGAFSNEAGGGEHLTAA